MTILRMLRPRRGAAGFTLVEMMVSLLVFSIATLGIVPLLAASMRGSTLSRSYTVGKNVTAEAMERVRGLPFFISYASKNRRVDVLDLFFPNLAAGYAGGTFTTTCTAASAADPACPKNIPDDTTVTYKATFVRTSTYGSTPVTYSVVVPPAGYRWDSATSADVPPSQLLEISVTTTWNVMAEPKTFSMKTLVADRKFGTTQVTGYSRVDYGIQAFTGFDILGTKSTASLLGASAESKAETRLLATADTTVNTGQIRLVRTSADPTVNAQDIGLSPLYGASAAMHAPPDVTPVGTSTASQTLTHPDWLTNGTPAPIAFIDASSTLGLSAKVANELPVSTGEARVSTSGSATAAWLDNQADRSQHSDMHFQLNASLPMLQVVKGIRTIQADTSATTTAATAADRKVELIGTTRMGEVRLIPTNYITGSEKTVVRVSDFQASVTCKSTANSTTAVATGTWSATLRYFSAAAAAYVSIPLNQTNAATEIANLKAANPIVYDRADPVQDVYLFKTGTVNGYLQSISTVTPTTAKATTGRTTSASIDGALRIDTAPLNPAVPESAMSVALGKLGCQSVDNR